jgi:hypothetical protein
MSIEAKSGNGVRGTKARLAERNDIDVSVSGGKITRPGTPQLRAGIGNRVRALPFASKSSVDHA